MVIARHVHARIRCCDAFSHGTMQAIVSGTASVRLARVQRTSPHTSTYGVGILSDDQVADALNSLDTITSASSASKEFKTAVQKRTSTHRSHASRQPDPSAIVLLSADELCRCGLFSLDVVQVGLGFDATMPLLSCPACNMCLRAHTRPAPELILAHRCQIPPGHRTASIWPPSCQCIPVRMMSGMATAVLAAGTMGEH